MENIFSYGNLLVPSVKKPTNITEPLQSVFIRGFKPIIKKHESKEYYYFLLEETNNLNDVVFGLIVKCEDINRLDQWEGKNYIRKEITAHNRYMERIRCFIYLAA